MAGDVTRVKSHSAMIVLMDTRTDVKRKSKRPFWSKMVYRGELMQHAEARSSVVMSQSDVRRYRRVSPRRGGGEM